MKYIPQWVFQLNIEDNMKFNDILKKVQKAAAAGVDMTLVRKDMEQKYGVADF